MVPRGTGNGFMCVEFLKSLSTRAVIYNSHERSTVHKALH